MENRFWFLLSKKLTAHATHEELEELAEFQKKHPDSQFPAHQLEQLWHNNPGNPANESAFEEHLERMRKLGLYASESEKANPSETSTPVPIQKNTLVAALLAACVIGLLGWFFWPDKAKTDGHLPLNGEADRQVLTAAGKKTKLVLPDGTQVWLNADSKLTYQKDFGISNREISLAGEAFFDVAKNEKLPFQITTSDIRIKVTGTAFNLKAYPDEQSSETSLIRGKIEVTVKDRPSEKYILHPNEKLVVRNQQLVDKPGSGNEPGQQQKSLPFIQLERIQIPVNDSIIQEASWMYNRLVFDDDSFEDIAKKMYRWYGVKVSIPDPEIAAIHFNYQIKNETVEEALANMQLTAHFHFTRNRDSILITK